MTLSAAFSLQGHFSLWTTLVIKTWHSRGLGAWLAISGALLFMEKKENNFFQCPHDGSKSRFCPNFFHHLDISFSDMYV